jgi:hypothetical protein
MIVMIVIIIIHEDCFFIYLFKYLLNGDNNNNREPWKYIILARRERKQNPGWTAEPTDDRTHPMDGRRRCLFYYYDDLQYRHLPHSAHTHTPEALTTGRSLRPFFPFSFWRLLFWFLYLNGPGCLGHSRRFRWEIGGSSSCASREWRYVYGCMHACMHPWRWYVPSSLGCTIQVHSHRHHSLAWEVLRQPCPE